MIPKAVQRLLLAVLIILVAVCLFIAACVIVDDLCTPRAIGEIWYEPIDGLSSGVSVMPLTAEV